MNNIDINGLVQSVTGAYVKDGQNKQNKRNNAKKEYSNKEDKFFVETLVIPTSFEEIEIPNRKGSTTIIKRPIVTDESVVEVLKINKPLEIDNQIYWFDNGHYLFSTDKDSIYNLHKKPRPFNDKEKDKIQKLRDEIKEMEEEAAEDIEIGNILLAAYRDNDEEVLNNPQNMIYFIKYPNPYCSKNLEIKEKVHELAEIIRQNEASGKFDNDELINEMKRLVALLPDLSAPNCITFLKDTQKKVNEIKNKKKEFTNLVHQIEQNCFENPIYEIHKLNYNNQVKVYTSSKLADSYKKKGYTIYKNSNKRKYKKWCSDTLNFVDDEEDITSLYFVMNTKAFLTSCKHGKVADKGYYFNDDGEPCIIENGSLCDTTVTVMVDGIPTVYNSIKEASKKLNIPYETIRGSKRNENGAIVINSKKSIMLIDADGNEFHYKNKSQLAKSFNVDKMKITRLMKNKTVGDTVVINGNEFVLGL